MARSTAPSMWLPGFDPEPLDLFVPATEADLAVASVPATDDGDFEEGVSSTSARFSWRAVTPADQAAARVLWPQLARADLGKLDGAVTKFEANLAAIDTLRRVEAENREAHDTERITLLRYTGWGGLPASFNLEGEDKAWRSRATQLRDTLANDEYESARASVNNSHYTEVHVIEAMWRAVEGFGFTGGRILEPAAGIGHFVGAMPRDMAQRSSVTAIEIDQLSGRLLKALYAPAGLDVRTSPFEKTSLADNWFDLVIGNVPFGKYKVADASNRAYARFSIHNYFFGRALDLVRPGGLVCFITSSHTMEAQAEAVREYIASQAHLLGAIRLPKGAFAGLASTEVQTDILFLRKRQRAEAVEAHWLKIAMVPDSLRHPHCAERYLPINAWSAERPEFCIGCIQRESNGYEEVPVAVFDGELEPALLERIALLPRDVYEPAADKPTRQRVAVPTLAGARPGSYRLHKGRVHRVDGSEMVDVDDQLNASKCPRDPVARIVRGCSTVARWDRRES